MDPKTKDKVLEYLCALNCFEKHINVKTENIRQCTGLTFAEINAILLYFDRNGFISELNCRSEIIYFIVHLEASDFFSRGGFFAQEELLKKNIEKLLLEIESLKPSIPEKVATITSIAANITAALGFFLPK